LDRIADEIDARGDAITAIGTSESGLPRARREGERGLTTAQLWLFADHIREGSYLERRHDAALPDHTPAPRPAIYMIQRPIGPVAVFSASNFPLALSTAGGDTAAALAAAQLGAKDKQLVILIATVLGTADTAAKGRLDLSLGFEPDRQLATTLERYI